MDSHPRLMALESIKAQDRHEQSPQGSLGFVNELQSRPPVRPGVTGKAELPLELLRSQIALELAFGMLS